MQVLSLTQEQINALPDQERGAILQLVRIRISLVGRLTSDCSTSALSLWELLPASDVETCPQNFTTVIYIRIFISISI